MVDRPVFKNVLVLGDSISDGFYDSEGLGWIGRLEILLHASNPLAWGFQNFSLSGDRTVDALYRLAGFLTRENSDYLFLSVGTNDIFRYGSSEAPVSMAMDLRHHYWDRIFRLAKPFVSKIVVFGLIPVNEELGGQWADDFGVPLYSCNHDIVEYNQAIKQWSEHENAIFIDFNDLFAKQGTKKLLLDDSHPNSLGHELMAQWAYEELSRKL